MTAALKVHIALFLFIAAMIAMAARLVQLEVEEKDFLQDQGDARTIRMQKINAHRGMILDRRGDPLAVSSPVVSFGQTQQSYRTMKAESVPWPLA